MPEGNTYQKTDASGVWKIAIAAFISVLSASLLGRFYAMASSHTGFRRPLIVFVIVVLALMFLFKWTRGFTSSHKRRLHLIIAGLSCYICWAASWDIHLQGEFSELSTLYLPLQPQLLFQKMQERFIYLSSNTRIFVYRPVVLWIVYLGEFASFVWLAMQQSFRRA